MTAIDGTMAFIKNEPDDHLNDPHQYMMTTQSYVPQQHFGHHYPGQPLGQSIDPSDLSSGNFGMPISFGSQQNLSSSFHLGNAGIGDDELLDLDFGEQNHIGGQTTMPPSSGAFSDPRQPNAISMNHQSQVSNAYSHTPEGAPIQSPFVQGNFNYDQFRTLSSPHANSGPFDNPFVHNNKRPSLQGLDRRSSDQRSPMTPKTPAMNGLHLGTPDSGSFPQPIRTSGMQNRHQKGLSSQWDNTPQSNSSLVDSPISSPGYPSHHAGISEILKSGKHASLPQLPAKTDSAHPSNGAVQNLETQEAKKRRRRASHNMVERRRRDNINERIQDLSHLVPQHRLDDDRVKKQIANNTALSPGAGGSSMSPPNANNAATSLLAGGNGRRAASTAGNVTLGFPPEDKEKGPNKGDILNGAVSWTRDLMWCLWVKIQQEEELARHIAQLGGKWPFEVTEDERRMRTELIDAVEKNDPSTFEYSRFSGSGLRVPQHTNIAGEPLPTNGSDSDMSPAFHSNGSSNSGDQGVSAGFWTGGNHTSLNFKDEHFKEEDEYGMEMS